MYEIIIEKYQEYTGKTLTEPEVASFTAWAKRGVSILESKLGWSLNEPRQIDVLGKSKSGCICQKIDLSKLDPAPTPVGEYRLYQADAIQPFVATDPFKTIDAVYACKVMPGGNDFTPQVVILKELENWAPKFASEKYGKFIQNCPDYGLCGQSCEPDCSACISFLVDASWMYFEDLPTELMYLLFDYMDWMHDGGYATAAIASESVDGHSITYVGAQRGKTPFDDDINIKVIAKYAGPYGNVIRQMIH